MRCSPLLAVAVLALAAFAGGCGGDPNIITGLFVTPHVGNNGTDEDIYFCFTPGASGRLCRLLDGHGDDMEEGDHDTYEIELDQPLDVADGVNDVAIEDRGGGFLSDGFTLIGLRVVAQLDSGDQETICTANEVVELDAGEEYHPSTCP